MRAQVAPETMQEAQLAPAFLVISRVGQGSVSVAEGIGGIRLQPDMQQRRLVVDEEKIGGFRA